MSDIIKVKCPDCGKIFKIKIPLIQNLKQENENLKNLIKSSQKDSEAFD